MTVLAVMLAGAVGAVLRFVVDGAVKQKWAPTFPWATVLINVTGSLVLGVLAGCVVFGDAPSSVQQIAGTGFCGGYTTFSTASFETVRLLERGKGVKAFGNAVGSLIASTAACAAGLALAWALSGGSA